MKAQTLRKKDLKLTMLEVMKKKVLANVVEFCLLEVTVMAGLIKVHVTALVLVLVQDQGPGLDLVRALDLVPEVQDQDQAPDQGQDQVQGPNLGLNLGQGQDLDLDHQDQEEALTKVLGASQRVKNEEVALTMRVLGKVHLEDLEMSLMVVRGHHKDLEVRLEDLLPDLVVKHMIVIEFHILCK